MLGKRNVVVLVHVLCWAILAVSVLFYPPSTWDIILPVNFWIKQVLLLVLLVATFYLNLAVLIPRLLIQQKVLYYVAALVVLVVLVMLMNTAINNVFHLDEFFSKNTRQPADNHHRHEKHFDSFVFGMTLLIIGLAITVSFIEKWQQELNLRQQLEKERVTTELTLLKAQINPHFFFNTLNTIYSYTLSDGDLARNAITSLSKMMRYVLYDAAGKQTLLSKEIAFIKEYTELMKLRISHKTSVLLELHEGVAGVMIAPMLFLPFVENAFKHGVSGIAAGQIKICITQHQDCVELLVLNTTYQTGRASEDDSNGIGVLNTSRRLELLYPGRYMLKAGMVNATEYEVKLNIKL